VASNAWITLDKGISRHHFMAPFFPQKRRDVKRRKEYVSWFCA